jgi:hypothetical protein
MILVRMVFQVKWGHTYEVVADFKEFQEIIQKESGGMRGRILTDLSGPFNTVVQEIEVESLAAWERQRAEVFSRPDFQERQARTADIIESGRVEFYTIEG